jgi:Uma2 family endonuclease
MTRRLKLGPDDHGRPLTFDEFMKGDYQGGYQYEIIDGMLYVSPWPELAEAIIECWLLFKLQCYEHDNPTLVKYVSCKSRVFVSESERVTAPEPGLAVYRKFPLHRPIKEVGWQDVSPSLVADVLFKGNPEKDLVRNVELFWRVPSIKEYWIIDARKNPNCPTMKVHRRAHKKWQVTDVAAGETYATKLLPGFELLLDPRRR